MPGWPFERGLEVEGDGVDRMLRSAYLVVPPSRNAALASPADPNWVIKLGVMCTRRHPQNE
jgi:hypothetical protein